MKSLAFILLCCAALQQAPASTLDEARWKALAMLESGNDDYAVGTRGEVSRYQILPRLWHQMAGTGRRKFYPDTPADALEIAREVWQYNARLSHIEPRRMSNQLWALTWHCPGRMFNPTRNDQDYADRFNTLVKFYEKQH